MIDLSDEAVALAERLAAAQRLPVEDAVRLALEEKAAALLAASPPPRRRASVEEMLATGDDITAMPLLDQRPPREIMDDLNAP